ncbi:MAG: hypothetical protein PHV98_07030 [Candidatus Omnitrophica bacterium]|jgi:hypothetical protein|nr:hypothetical protein [Candidatus Omnitrophota bacterium]
MMNTKQDAQQAGQSTTKQIVTKIAEQLRVPREQWEQLPNAVQQLVDMAIQPRFLLTLEIDVATAQIRNLISSQLPEGGTATELFQLAQAATQLAQYFQQRALDVAKREGTKNDEANADRKTR